MTAADPSPTLATRDEIERAFDTLDRWIATNGWAGYDPYDVRGQNWYVSLFGGQSHLLKKARSGLALLESRISPLLLRRLLRVKKRINAKGMGLLASAWLHRWQQTNDDSYRERAEEALRWLVENRCPDHAGVSWGYPFHWQSRIFLPRGTPSVVVSGTAGGAFLDHFELTGSERSLETAAEIAKFMMQSLNRPIDDRDRLCFSYTPIDQFKVHNANLFAAAHLARYGALSGRDECVELALRSARYTISEQNSDGSFYYWGSESPTTIDHYHTGFVLRHLDTVCKSSDVDFISGALERGYAFYLNQLFTPDGLPKYTPDALYPIDIHSCAEAIICLQQLGDGPAVERTLESVFALTQRRMRKAEGWYVAALRKRNGHEVTVDIPYMRWGQAWMLLALSKLLDSLPEDAAEMSQETA